MRKKNLTDKRMTDSRGKVMTFFFLEIIWKLLIIIFEIFLFCDLGKEFIFPRVSVGANRIINFFLRWMHFWKRMRCVLKKNLHTFLESSIDRVEKKKFTREQIK